jgi:hypothetical protein
LAYPRVGGLRPQNIYNNNTLSLICEINNNISIGTFGVTNEKEKKKKQKEKKKKEKGRM